MKRTPLRRVSKKRAALNKLRSAFVREQLKKRPHCEVREMISASRFPGSVPLSVIDNISRHCTGVATELHEPLTRARAPGAETILDPANSIAICPGCHRWVHDHPAAATSLGLLRSSGG